jgi:hypothetical protein
LSELDAFLRKLTWKNPKIPLEICTSGSVCLSYNEGWNPSRYGRVPVYFHEAVKRVEDCLGACIWFEAGFDTPIIPMLKRAASSSNGHDFQPIRPSISDQSWNCISTVVSELWRLGISLSHWASLDDGHAQFKQVWLPPYQFEKHQYWTENIDRAMEAHQKLAAVAPDNTEPKNEAMPSRIIYRKESFIADSRVNEFSINTKSHRFQKVVTGHAVLQQPLCPAPMYMECTTMAIQTLRGGIETSNIAFEDLQFVFSAWTEFATRSESSS